MTTNNSINAPFPISILQGGSNNSATPATNAVIYFDGTKLTSTSFVTMGSNGIFLGNAVFGFQGNLNQDRYYILDHTNGSKIASSGVGSTFSFDFYAGLFTTAGGGVSTGQFTWSTVNTGGNGWTNCMVLSNAGNLTLSQGSLTLSGSGNSIKLYNAQLENFYTDAGSTLKGSIGPGRGFDLTLQSVTGGNWLRLGSASGGAIAFWYDGNVTANDNPNMKLSSAGLYIASLSASSGVFTDGSSNLTTTGILGIAQGGTNQTSFVTPVSGLNPIPFFNGTSFVSTAKFGYDSVFDIMRINSNTANPQMSISTSITGSANSASTILTRGDQANGGCYQYWLTNGVASLWQNGLYPGSNDLVFAAASGFNNRVMTLNQTTGNLIINSGIQTIINSNSAPTAPTATTQLNISSSTQSSARIVLSGQEFDTASNTSTEGLALVLGRNRANDRELYIGDSLLLGVGATNPVIRFNIGGVGANVQIDSLSTNRTVLPINFGNGGATTTIAGNGINLNSNGQDIPTQGNLVINSAGKTLKIKTGANSCSGVGAVMVAGSVTVNTTAVATGDIIFIMKTTNGGTTTTGMPSISISNGVSFTITGSSLDTSTWSWIIFKTA